jgi:predicted outer membrane lipoprotein
LGSHPINLALRFLLEISALAAIGFWGWKQGEGGLRFILAIGVPVFAASVWGTFAVPEDSSRSGKAPVPVSGILRLVIESAFFSFATWSLYKATGLLLACIFGIVTIIHYAISYDRLIWLIKHKRV